MSVSNCDQDKFDLFVTAIKETVGENDVTNFSNLIADFIFYLFFNFFFEFPKISWNQDASS